MEFADWFQQQFVDRMHPWKDGMVSWHQLPAGFRSMTFTQALADWNRDQATQAQLPA